MYIGSVLLQPQRLSRAVVTDSSQALVEDVLSLATRVAVDKSMGGHILETMEQSFEALVSRILTKIGAGLEKSQEDLRKQVKPLVDFLPEFVKPLTEGADPVKVLDSLLDLIELMAGGLRNLSVDQVRTIIKAVLDIFQKDLGLNSNFIQDQIWALIDNIIARLQALPTEANKTVRDNRLGTISTLRRLKRHLKDQFVFPEISADAVATQLVSSLRRAEIDKVTRKVSCVGKGIGEFAKAGKALLDIVPYTGFTAQSLGAGEGGSERVKYLWYPSWVNVFGSYSLISQSGIELYVDLENEQILKADGDQLVQATTDWKALSVFAENTVPHYSFKPIGADAMEGITHHLAWLADVAEMIFNATKLRDGERASTVSNAFVDGAHGFFKALSSPFSFWLLTDKQVAKNNFFGQRLANLPTILATGLGSLEGLHTNATGGNAFKFWFMLLLADIKNAASSYAIPQLFYKLFISILTLINNGDPDNPTTPPVVVPIPGQDPTDVRTLNRREVAGVVDLVMAVTGYIHAKSVPRKNYIHPFWAGSSANPPGVSTGEQFAKMWLLYDITIGLGLGILGSLVGTLIAQAIARQFDEKVLLKSMFLQTLKLIGMFWITHFGFNENDTDDGKYNPRGPDFAGYPDPTNSPYMLPWQKGKSWMCVQGNQGFWSHNDFGFVPQVYAYDMALDQGTEVLAARAGTVVDYFDWIADDEHPDVPGPGDSFTDPKFAVWKAAMDEAAASGFLVPSQTTNDSWNFIVIRHDEAGDPIADHDKDEGGTVVTTYCVNGHGRKGSVRQTFGARSVAPASIIGTKVLQGQPIMLAGNTGNSFHNHLHIHVQPGPPAATAAPISRNSLGARTIPFVFKEDNKSDAVPKSLTFYTSKTEKI